MANKLTADQIELAAYLLAVKARREAVREIELAATERFEALADHLDAEADRRQDRLLDPDAVLALWTQQFGDPTTDKGTRP